LFSIFVSPQFSEKEADKQTWRGMQGLLLLRRSAFALVRAEQLRRGAFYTFTFDVQKRAKIYLRGCGTSYSAVHEPSSIHLELDSVDADGSPCVVDGFAKASDGIVDIGLLVTRFDDDFARLAEPVIEQTGGMFKVFADSSVSLISFDGQSVFGNEAKFMVKAGTLKLYTVKGRAAYCRVYNNGEYKCFH